MTAAWKLLALRGAIALVLGIILIVWPKATIVVLMVLIGLWALIDGIGLAAQVFAKGASTGQRVFFGVMALVALFVALFAIVSPDKAAVGVAVVIGILSVAWGIVFVVLALAARSATKDLPDGVDSLPPE